MTNNNNRMISVEEAKSRAFSSFSILGSEQIAVSNAFGRVLAEDIYSRVNQPPVAVSSMDGYAVRAIDVRTVPRKLKLIGESSAGSSFGSSLSGGQTVRIFTGAALPRGADSIVIQENTIKHSGTVTILTSAKKGDYVRPKGLDFRKGKKLITAGQKLNYRHLSLIAAMNVPWVSVVRKPRIAILATGSELVMPGEINNENQIVSSNSIGLATFVTACGGEALNLGIAEDKPESILKLVSQIDTTDLLVTIGGASVGEYDLVRPVLIKKGLKIKFNKVAMRPGKPLIFGTIDKLPMFGLPGNPVSAGVTA
ncbi:MAG: Molybdopterin molybdenumtransferase, partial [Alphaproteobacteria bacterium MarineAlpha3_Bin7]